MNAAAPGATGGSCVEVTGDLAGLVGVRESKDAGGPGPVLAFGSRNRTAFLAGVKAGRLAH